MILVPDTHTIIDEQASAWNAALRRHKGHLLQSWEWGEFKSRHGWHPERIVVETADGAAWAQVLFRFRGPISIGYVPRGPLLIGNRESAWRALRGELDRLARKHRAISIILEPDEALNLDLTGKEAGIAAGPEHNQPARTVILPLAADEEMLKHMHQKTRYSVRLAMRRGVEVEIADPTDQDAIDRYFALLSDTANRNEFSVHSREYYADFLDVYGDNAFFAFAHYEGQLAAVVISAAFGDTGTYMYGATSTEHRGHGASFLLQYEAMKWSRDRGCKYYDLWGIPKRDPESVTSDDRTAIAGTKGDDWRGIYRFKTGFGGSIVTLPDTWERVYVPGMPWLARKLGVIQS